MIKNFIVNLFFKYYFRDKYQSPLSDTQIDYLLTKISNGNQAEMFELYLNQLITNSRNKYLYSNDPVFKGAIMAYDYLKKQLSNRKAPKVKEKITKAEEVVKMKSRGY